MHPRAVRFSDHVDVITEHIVPGGGPPNTAPLRGLEKPRLGKVPHLSTEDKKMLYAHRPDLAQPKKPFTPPNLSAPMSLAKERAADVTIARAARAIAQADFLLLAAGAGMSADSGLPVYRDCARFPAYEAAGVDYGDLCRPTLVDDDPALFYGFWGRCAHDYARTDPHGGYATLRRWASRPRVVGASGAGPVAVAASSIAPSFVYTSNVDAHFRRAGFDGDRVFELHGSCETWQCRRGVAGVGADEAVRGGCEGIGDEGGGCGHTWSLPEGTRVAVDDTTRRAAMSEGTPSDPSFPLLVASAAGGTDGTDGRAGGRAGGHDGGHAGGEDAQSATPLRCPACGGRPRPAVLMFEDTNWAGNKEAEARYVAWEEQMEGEMARTTRAASTTKRGGGVAAAAANNGENAESCGEKVDLEPHAPPAPRRVVIVEIGCGLRVPCVRQETELVVEDTLARCALARAEAATEGGGREAGAEETVASSPMGAEEDDDIPRVLLIRINLAPEEVRCPPGWEGEADEADEDDEGGDEDEGGAGGSMGIEEAEGVMAEAAANAGLTRPTRANFLGLRGRAQDVIRMIDRSMKEQGEEQQLQAESKGSCVGYG